MLFLKRILTVFSPVLHLSVTSRSISHVVVFKHLLKSTIIIHCPVLHLSHVFVYLFYVFSFLWCILLWCVVLKKMFLFCVNYVCVVVCLESGWERKGAPKKGCCKKKLLVLQKPCMMGKECSLSQGVSYRTVGLDTTVHTLQHAVWYAGYSTRGRLGVSSTFSL